MSLCVSSSGASPTESIELLFPIQKNFFKAVENKFVSINRTKALVWVMGEKAGVFGWHPEVGGHGREGRRLRLASGGRGSWARKPASSAGIRR